MNLETVAQQEFADHQFISLTHNKATIQSKTFHGCTFKGCSFNEAIFQACNFSECRFEECDLSLAHFPYSTFQETRFEQSKLVGINWSEVNWTPQGLLKKKFVDFHECILDYSIFIGLRLEGMDLCSCSAKHAAFEETNLTSANCTKTDFMSSRFVRTDLTKADFTGAVNYDIDAQLNTLHKTKFSLPEAVSLLRSLDIILTE